MKLNAHTSIVSTYKTKKKTRKLRVKASQSLTNSSHDLIISSIDNNDNSKTPTATTRQTAKAFLDKRLATGGALGNVVFSSSNGIRFKCTKDCIGGRGLRVFASVPKGATIARGQGIIVKYNEIKNELENPTSQFMQAFKIWDSKDTILQLLTPTTDMPANLANTSDGRNKNNCRIRHKSGTDYFSIETVKALQPGEEVTVAYGSKYTKMLRTAAAIEAIAIKRDKSVNGNTLIRCDLCNFILLKRRLKLHRGHIGCITRQKLSQERLVILEHKLMKTKKCLVQP